MSDPIRERQVTSNDHEDRKLGWTDRPGQSLEMAAVFLLTSGALLVGQLQHYHVMQPGYVPELTSRRVLISLGFELVAAALLGAMLLHRGWPLRRILAFRPGDIGMALALFGIVMLTALAFGVIANVLTTPAKMQADFRTSVHVSLGVIPLVALINPIFEELLWLGYWFRRFESRGIWLAGTISIALRTLAHLWKGPLGALTIVPIGFIFTAYYVQTRRLWPIVIAHAMMDSLSLIAIGHIH
jgi:CAAX protease family protein